MSWIRGRPAAFRGAREATLRAGSTEYSVRRPRIRDYPHWRRTRIDEKARLAAAFGSPDADWPDLHSPSAWVEWVTSVRSAARRREALPFVLLEHGADGPRLVGEIGVGAVDPRTGTGELYAWAVRTAPEVVPWAVAQVISRTFDPPFALDRIVAPTARGNRSVHRALEVLRFEHRATRRRFRMYAGEPTDHDLWVMDNTPHNRARIRRLAKMKTTPVMRIDDTVVVRMTHTEVIDLVERRAAEPSGAPLALCSATLDQLHHFRPGRHRLGRDVDWVVVADGAPIARRGAHLAGTDWPRVTGADLLPDVIALCEARGWPIGFLGGTAHAHGLLRDALHRDHPGLSVAGYWSPERAELDDPVSGARIADEIRSAAPTVLVVGLGKPRQEQWIDDWGTRSSAAVLLPFGAAADFVAGTVERAPERWQRSGLEWLYRLQQEPRRLARRYLIQGPPALARLRAATIGEITSPAAFEPGDRP